MSNSPLATYVRLSPNRNSPRKQSIQVITPHHQAGNLTAEQIGSIMANPARAMSATYAIQSDGRISRHLDEGDRPWTSSSPSNDHKAITIEVANDGGPPNWHVSDPAVDALIELSVDICKRNGIKKVVYTSTPAGNLTRHNMFANTLCPGPYLQSKFPYIEQEVNRRLNSEVEEMPTPISTSPVRMYFGPVSGGDAAKIQQELARLNIQYTRNNNIISTTPAVSAGDQPAILKVVLELGNIPYGPVTQAGISQTDYDAVVEQRDAAQRKITTASADLQKVLNTLK